MKWFLHETCNINQYHHINKSTCTIMTAFTLVHHSSRRRSPRLRNRTPIINTRSAIQKAGSSNSLNQVYTAARMAHFSQRMVSFNRVDRECPEKVAVNHALADLVRSSNLPADANLLIMDGERMRSTRALVSAGIHRSQVTSVERCARTHNIHIKNGIYSFHEDLETVLAFPNPYKQYALMWLDTTNSAHTLAKFLPNIFPHNFVADGTLLAITATTRGPRGSNARAKFLDMEIALSTEARAFEFTIVRTHTFVYGRAQTAFYTLSKK